MYHRSQFIASYFEHITFQANNSLEPQIQSLVLKTALVESCIVAAMVHKKTGLRMNQLL